MKKYLKKLLVALLTVVLSLGGISGTAFAAKVEYVYTDEQAAELFGTEGLAAVRPNGVPCAISQLNINDDETKVMYSHLRSQAKVPGSKILKIFRVSVPDADIDDPKEVRISIDRVKAGQGYVVWSYDGRSAIWNNSSISVKKVEDGKLTLSVKNPGSAIAIINVGSTAVATNEGIYAKTIKLNLTKATMSLHEQLQLGIASYTPANATDIDEVTWTSSNTSAFIVDENGLVTCVGAGNAKITATTLNGKKATCNITGPKQASSVKITGPKTIDYQGTAQLSAEVKPFNAVDKSVTWSVDKGNGTVDENGLVTCNGPGDIKVRATTKNGKKSTYTLKGPKAASSVKISGEKTVEFQKSVVLTATVKPENAPDKRVEWSKIKGNGEIHDNGDGTCTVTCTGAGDIKVQARTIATNKKATFTVKGPRAASSVKITGEKTVEFQKSVTLTATVKPDNAPDKRVEWTKVKGNGDIHDNGDGTCSVTCTGPGDIKVQARTIATNKKATFTVKGPKAATSVSVKKSSYKLAVGESVQPTATVNPKGVIDPNVIWSSSDSAIATVTPEGVITAVAPGKTTILATAHNGKVGKCTVTVQ